MGVSITPHFVPWDFVPLWDRLFLALCLSGLEGTLLNYFFGVTSDTNRQQTATTDSDTSDSDTELLEVSTTDDEAEIYCYEWDSLDEDSSEEEDVPPPRPRADIPGLCTTTVQPGRMEVFGCASGIRHQYGSARLSTERSTTGVIRQPEDRDEHTSQVPGA